MLDVNKIYKIYWRDVKECDYMYTQHENINDELDFVKFCDTFLKEKINARWEGVSECYIIYGDIDEFKSETNLTIHNFLEEININYELLYEKNLPMIKWSEICSLMTSNYINKNYQKEIDNFINGKIDERVFILKIQKRITAKVLKEKIKKQLKLVEEIEKDNDKVFNWI